MNRIVLIGNGFDLAHGLKTSYKDFIDDLWKRKINEFKKEPFNRITDEDIEIKGIDFYNNRLPNHIATYEDLKDYNHPSRANRLIINYDGKNEFLKTITEHGNLKNWVDIENEYFISLKEIVLKKTWLNTETIKLNENFLLIKTYLESFLYDEFKNKSKNAGIKTIQKISEILFSHLIYHEFTAYGKDQYVNEITQELNNMVEHSNNRASSYIRREHVDLFSDVTFNDNNGKYILNTEKLYKYLLNPSLSSIFRDFKPTKTLFLNFNYTQTELEYTKNRLFKENEIEVNHIHGTLNNNQNPIIFGYGDEIGKDYALLEEENNNNLLENVKSIRYLDTDNYKKLLEYIDSDKYQVIILGHSCGNSDRTLLNTLFEHENCVSIKPYYYQYTNDKGEIKDNYSDIVRNISRSFTDKKSMRDKVVNKTYTTWFSSNVKE